MDLTIVSLVGITTRRAETIVRCYELVTAPSYIHTHIHRGAITQVCLQGVPCTWPQEGICSCVCHYILHIHSEPLISCNASLLQSNITTITQFKQLWTVTEHKYTVNVTGIMHEHHWNNAWTYPNVQLGIWDMRKGKWQFTMAVDFFNGYCYYSAGSASAAKVIAIWMHDM